MSWTLLVSWVSLSFWLPHQSQLPCLSVLLCYDHWHKCPVLSFALKTGSHHFPAHSHGLSQSPAHAQLAQASILSWPLTVSRLSVDFIAVPWHHFHEHMGPSSTSLFFFKLACLLSTTVPLHPSSEVCYETWFSVEVLNWGCEVSRPSWNHPFTPGFWPFPDRSLSWDAITGVSSNTQ